jgi:hypothetical protein
MVDLSPQDVLAIEKLAPRFGSLEETREFYLSSPIPAFSGRTAADIVKSGHEDWLWHYIEAVGAGVFA